MNWQVQYKWEQWFQRNDHLLGLDAIDQREKRQQWNLWYQSSFQPAFHLMRTMREQGEKGQQRSESDDDNVHLFHTCIPICAKTATAAVVPLCMVWNTELEYSLVDHSIGSRLLHFGRNENDKIYHVRFVDENRVVHTVRCVLRLIHYRVISHRIDADDPCAIVPHDNGGNGSRDGHYAMMTMGMKTKENHHTTIALPIMWSIFSNEFPIKQSGQNRACGCYMGRRSMMPHDFIHFPSQGINSSPLRDCAISYHSHPAISQMTKLSYLYLPAKVSIYQCLNSSDSNDEIDYQCTDEYYVRCIVSTVRNRTVIPLRMKSRTESHHRNETEVIFDFALIDKMKKRKVMSDLALISLPIDLYSDSLRMKQMNFGARNDDQQPIVYLGHDFIRHFGCLFYQGRPIILHNQLSLLLTDKNISRANDNSTDLAARTSDTERLNALYIDQHYNRKVSEVIDSLGWTSSFEKTCRSFSLYYQLGNGVSLHDYVMRGQFSRMSNGKQKFHKRMRWRDFILIIHSCNGDEQQHNSTFGCDSASEVKSNNLVPLTVSLDYKSKYSVLYLTNHQHAELNLNRNREMQLIDHTNCTLISIETKLRLALHNVTYAVTEATFPLAVVSLRHLLRHLRLSYSAIPLIQLCSVIVEFDVFRRVHTVPCMIESENDDSVSKTVVISEPMAEVFNVQNGSSLYIASPRGKSMFKAFVVQIQESHELHFLILRMV